jgi:hypothetical protein
LVEPLAKALVVFDASMQIDEQESSADILNLLRQQFTKYKANTHSSLLKTMILCMKRLQKFYGEAKSEQRKLLSEIISSIKTNLDTGLIAKYNLFMIEQPLVSFYSLEEAQD